MLHETDHIFELRWAAAGWEPIVDRFGKGHQCHEVALLDHQVGQAESDELGVLELAQASACSLIARRACFRCDRLADSRSDWFRLRTV